MPLTFCSVLQQHLCSCLHLPALLSKGPFCLQSTKTLQNTAKYSLGANNRTCRSCSASSAVFHTSTFWMSHEIPSSESDCSARQDPHAHTPLHPPGTWVLLAEGRGEPALHLPAHMKCPGTGPARQKAPSPQVHHGGSHHKPPLLHAKEGLFNCSPSLCSCVTAMCTIGLLPPLRLQ